LTNTEISKEIYELLIKIARKRGVTVNELILECISKNVDPKVKIEIYTKLHEKYLREAEELYNKGNIVQACEKYWGALTTLLSIIAEKEGLPHYSHRDLRDVIEFLTEKTNDPEYSRLFSSAEALHANFYHGFMGKLSFDAHRNDVIRLIQKIKEFMRLELR